MTNSQRMEKKLSWIDQADSDQIKYLANYLSKCDWFDNTLSSFSPEANVRTFIENALAWNPDDKTIKNRCHRLKAAWSRWSQRKINKDDPKVAEGAYTISKQAKKELERLAKKEKCSFSQVIEGLLIQSRTRLVVKDTTSIQSLKSLAEEVAEVGHSDTTQALQCEISHLQNQLSQFREENSKLKLKINQLENAPLLNHLRSDTIKPQDQENKSRHSQEEKSGVTSPDKRQSSPQLASVGKRMKPAYPQK
ncbi:TPA: hypothetical protein RQJ46_004654 [Vibrio vulnificus]|nr:hypothetical protein [Vibrio vulnificus]HDY7424918.1 hypothetical protein [Vibrio vulnificus]HDY7497696.1 hypothetical protein [Vibrio vulnificus]HDY7498644.1 hypothetical protein [Vibrio vulnificus]